MSENSELNSIDGVIERLEAIGSWSKEASSRAGYFATLYRHVTVAVRDRIRGGGFFDDDQRMERLDVLFARRYLDAFDDWRDGRPTMQSWAIALRVSSQWWPIVLQHLLLGINAHINLDLGIATAATAGSPSELPNLRNDFNRINELLAAMVGRVQSQLAAVWPMFRWLDESLGSLDEGLINFSIERARNQAWHAAEQFVALNEADCAPATERLDARVVRIARAVRYPSIVTSSKLKLIRLGERGSVRSTIEILEQ